ncbi:MAG: hypothetical protein RL418_31 [Actinomycetota bacterium]|jgi:hypothetical protein
MRNQLELLLWDGCPSQPEARELARDFAQAVGLEITETRITDFEQAQKYRFIGSPTFRVNGVDLVPDENPSFGLTCRVYRRPEGKISPLPSIQQLKEGLRSLNAD